MKQSTKAKIEELGFANMGDHFSLHLKKRTVTITERKMGETTMLEVLVTIKTRQLNSLEKENLAKIAVMNRESRLESINIGEQTSLLLSIVIPEDEADSLKIYIEKVCKYLDRVAGRLDGEKADPKEEELLLFDICG